MISFVENRNKFLIVSGSIIALFIIIAAVFGVKLDIQFTGGSIVTYSYTGEVSLDDAQAAAGSAVSEGVTVRENINVASGEKTLVVSLNAEKGLTTDRQQSMTDSLRERFPDSNISVLSSSNVDPTIGREFFVKCLVAVLLAAILIVLYVAIRFRRIGGWSAGVMAVVALLHDLIIVFATFTIFRIPLGDNFIAVLLVILGYSINDTIVIYDRIRENERIYGAKLNMNELVNKSINQSLTRSINTTISTVLALATICVVALVFNVTSILSFAFPMIIGMISGVYSTICIAGPLWVWYQNKKAAKQ